MSHKVSTFSKIADHLEVSDEQYFPRRKFLKKIASFTAGSILSLALAGSIAYAEDKATTNTDAAPNDQAKIEAYMMTYPSSLGNLHAYMASPPIKPNDKFPAVLVIHDNKGLDEHAKALTRRLAEAGYLAMATDYLSHQGKTPEDANKARIILRDIPKALHGGVSDAGYRYLATHTYSNSRVAVIGLGWGGGQVNTFLSSESRLVAAISYYGYVPIKLDEVAKIQTPLLLHHADLKADQVDIDAFEAALKSNNKVFSTYKYEGTNKVFDNETDTQNYNRAASDLAWQRSLDFLKAHLDPK